MIDGFSETLATHTQDLEALAGQGDAKTLLREAHRLHRDRLAVATSFGAEDMVLIELVRQLKEETGEQIRLFTLDTGRLPEETLQLLDRVRTRMALQVEVFFPQPGAVHQLLTTKGPFSFFDSPEARRGCCETRKVEPLSRALARVDVWVTGLRREQSPTRAALDVVQVDVSQLPRLHRRLIKLNPLADWAEADVWRFIDEHKVPTHRLHDAGYPSIGCAPCTRAVGGWKRGGDHGVDVRAGRWWWEHPEHKECGLHPLPVSPSDDPRDDDERNDAPAETPHAA
jgi:phosphoadenosine phosphosulfate reductase